MIKKIIVHGLHYYTTEATIREKFSEYGPVTDFSILKDSDGKYRFLFCPSLLL